MDARILVVDDEPEIADLVEVYLKSEGCTVFKCGTGAQALSIVQTQDLDLAILDVMLPDSSGFTLCSEIRKDHRFPVLMLTAKGNDMDKITGLTIGADDYITKPFSVAVLKARLENILRRRTADHEADQTIVSGDIVLNLKTFRASCGGRELDLSMTEFRLLQYLMEHRNQALLKEQILRHIWDEGGNYVEENTLSVNVSRLRKKLGGDHIRTVQGIGYLWEEN